MASTESTDQEAGRPKPEDSPLEVAVNTNRLFVDGYSAVLEIQLRNRLADESFRAELGITSTALPDGASWDLLLAEGQHRQEIADLALPRSHEGQAGSAGEKGFRLDLVVDAGPDGRHRFTGYFILTVLEYAESRRDINVHIEKVIEQTGDGGMGAINSVDLRNFLNVPEDGEKSINDLLAEQRPPHFVPIELTYESEVRTPPPPGRIPPPLPVLGKVGVLCSENKPDFYEIRAEWLAIGRSGNCHLKLEAPHVSSHHATLARVASGLLVVDHQSQNGTWYDGQRITHRFLQNGDIIRIDKFWLVCKLAQDQELRAVDNELRGTIGGTRGATLVQAEEAGDAAMDVAADVLANAQVRLAASSGRQVASDAKPILIGHDSSCGLRLGGDGIARFHAVVYWDRTGVCIEDLQSGQGSPVVNGKPVRRARLGDRDVVEIGGHRIAVSLLGDVGSRAKELAEFRPSTRGLAITCVEGPGRGETIPLSPMAESFTLGRDGDCNLRLPSNGLSGCHAQVRRELIETDDGNVRPEYVVSDLASVTGTSVNAHRLNPEEQRRLEPGDVIRLGSGNDHCDLLVHHRF